MSKEVRLHYDEEKYTLEICEHISINGYENKDEFPSCKYVEFLKITCNKCEETYNIEIKVN